MTLPLLPLPDDPGFARALAPGERLLWQGRSQPMRASRIAFLGAWAVMAAALMAGSGTDPLLTLAFGAFLAAGGWFIHRHHQDVYAVTNHRALAWRQGLLREEKLEAVPLRDIRVGGARGHLVLHNPVAGQVRFTHLPRADRRRLMTDIPPLAKAAP